MKAHMIGLVVVTFVLVIGPVAVACAHAPGGDIKQAGVITYSGDHAKAFFPAYVNQLKADSKNGDGMSRAAQRALDTVTKNRLLAFQVEMKSSAEGSAVPLTFKRTPKAFPAHPENGETVTASACVLLTSSKRIYRQINAWQYNAKTHEWMAMNNDYHLVSRCESDQRGVKST